MATCSQSAKMTHIVVQTNVTYCRGVCWVALNNVTHMHIQKHIIAKHKVFQLVEQQQITLRQAAEQLGLSYRQTLRWWKRYQKASGSLLNVQVSPRGGGWNRKSGDIAQAVIDCKKQYPHRSYMHIAEEVTEQHGNVSPATVRRILESTECIEPNVRSWNVHRRFESEGFGERLQMDTTSGAWMRGYRLVYLIAVMDEYSRMIVGSKWVDSDSTWNNMMVLRSVFSRYGLPKMLYTDNASMFKTIRHGKSIYQNHRKEGYETVIQRTMRELGVTMFSHKPYHPQGKGKIERFFRFMQQRFIREHTATNLDELNQQFTHWIRWYNTRHINRTTQSVPKDRVKPSVWSPVPGKRRLDSAFCFKTTRKVDKCNSFSIEGQTYTIDTKHCMVAFTVTLEITPTEIRVFHAGDFIQTFQRIKNI